MSSRYFLIKCSASLTNHFSKINVRDGFLNSIQPFQQYTNKLCNIWTLFVRCVLYSTQ